MPDPLPLTIAILHYNDPALTFPCLQAVWDAEENLPPHEILVVDNGSDPEKQWHALRDERVVFFPVNLGNIGGQNACFREARGEWVLWMANDVRVDPSCLRMLWQARRQEAILQPWLVTPQGTTDNTGLYWRWPGYGVSRKTPKDTTTDAVTSTCYLLLKRHWQVLGGFDETLQTSHEDIDFCLRLKQHLGIVSACAPLATATHLMNATLKHTLPHPQAAFTKARRQVITKHYRGLDRTLRLLTLTLLGR